MSNRIDRHFSCDSMRNRAQSEWRPRNLISALSPSKRLTLLPLNGFLAQDLHTIDGICKGKPFR